MKWIALGVVAFVTLMLMAGCGESSTSSGAVQQCQGEIVNCVLNDRTKNTIGVAGHDTTGSAGDAPEINTAGSEGGDNPYNCPVDTVIRSDCSDVSQRNCVCMLP